MSFVNRIGVNLISFKWSHKKMLHLLPFVQLYFLSDLCTANNFSSKSMNMFHTIFVYNLYWKVRRTSCDFMCVITKCSFCHGYDKIGTWLRLPSATAPHCITSHDCLQMCHILVNEHKLLSHVLHVTYCLAIVFCCGLLSCCAS